MNIVARRLTLLLICLPFSLFAQYTETINSNRPGNSQGAFAVGQNVLQFELGLGYGKEKHALLFTDANVISVDYAARYGLLMERLEINAIGSYQNNNITFNNNIVSGTYTQANFKLNSIGAKYLLYDPYRMRELEKPNLYSYHANFKFRWRELIPAVAVYAGANFDSEDNPFSPEFEATISPRFAVITQNNFNGGWVFVTNFLAERIATDFPSYTYLITLTHAFNPKFSMFLENEGIFSDFYADQLIRGGAAYLLNTEFSLDASVLLNWKDTPSRTFFKLGASYRFDMHKKDEYIEEKGDKEAEPKKQRKRKDDVEVDDGGF